MLILNCDLSGEIRVANTNPCGLVITLFTKAGYSIVLYIYFETNYKSSHQKTISNSILKGDCCLGNFRNL